MEQSLPPPPSQTPSRPSTVDEEEDKKRRSIYGELKTYLDGLKASSSSRPSSSSEQPQVNESGDENDGPSIDFPDNFDDVVSLMSRADLEFGEVRRGRHNKEVSFATHGKTRVYVTNSLTRLLPGWGSPRG
jgi:hypothetical protein